MQDIQNKFWRDKGDAIPAYYSLQTTSGLANEWVVTGETVNTDLLTLHSYQLIADPTGVNTKQSINTVSGSFAVQVSMDQNYWTNIFSVNVHDNTTTGVLYADTWGYPFARTIIGGMFDATDSGMSHPEIDHRSGAFIVRETHIT